MLRAHKFTDAKGLLLMIQKLGFLNFIRNRGPFHKAYKIILNQKYDRKMIL